MVPSLQANQPRWNGQGFEIWFFVVLLPGAPRALWVRLTRIADDQGSDARAWAVVSEDGHVEAERDTLALAAMTSESEAHPDFHLRVGEAGEFAHGFSNGHCGGVRWSFTYEASDPAVIRLPQLPGFIPLGTHSTHPHAEAPVQGFVELDGRRIDLDGGLLTQMHIWGQKRVEWLRWAWVPQFVGGGALELTAVAPEVGKIDARRDPTQHLCALWLRIGDGPQAEIIDNSGLGKTLRARVQSIRPGVLHHVGSSGRRRVVVRVWAAAETFAGWKYRKIGGGDLAVAQTNLARCEVELYRRSGLGWVPETRLRSTCAALEFHGPDDFAELAYVPWEATSARGAAVPGTLTIADVSASASASVSTTASASAEPAATDGAWIDTPRPATIVALGLTYREHAKETGSRPDPLVFREDPAAWTPIQAGASGDGVLLRPSSARLLAAARELDRQLPTLLAEFGFLPAMLDYEVELGLLLLDGLPALEGNGDGEDGLEAMAAAGRVALVVANDVTARSLQILGEGQDDRMAYWGAAKSLPGFAPTTARAWVPARFDLDRWPALRLQTRVNGVLRQDAETAALIETPRQMLTRVREASGALPANTLLLTGTPAGVAFSVPAWKRALGEHFLDRVGKLRAALGSFGETTDYLRPGDVVEVRAGFLGGFALTVDSEPEPG